MKRIFVFFLFCFAATGAFAQWAMTFHWKYISNIMTSLTPTGLYAQKIVEGDDGQDRLNSSGSTHLSPVSWLLPGNPGYVPKGDIGFFTGYYSTRAYSNDISDSLMRIHFSRGNVYMLFGISLWPIMNSPMEQTISIRTIFNWLGLGEYWLRVLNPRFELHVTGFGTANKVPSYFDLSDWSRQWNIATFGVSLPPMTAGTLFTYIDNDLRHKVNPSGYSRVGDPVLMYGTINLREFIDLPLFVDLAWNVNYNSFNRMTGSSSPAQQRIDGAMAFRGLNILDTFSFDLVYKLRGGDGNLNDSYRDPDGDLPNSIGGYKTDGTEAMSHVLSLAMGFPYLIPRMPFSVAYTAAFFSYGDNIPKPHEDRPVITRTGPFFSGINFNFRFTGIPRVPISMTNSISFARTGESVFDDDYSATNATGIRLGLSGSPLPRYMSQEWLALYNTLAARYQINNTMLAKLEVTHLMSVITDINSNKERGDQRVDWGRSQKMKNVLQTSAYVNFDLGFGIRLQPGVSLIIENASTVYSNYIEPDFDGPRKWSAGAVGFAMPICMYIVW